MKLSKIIKNYNKGVWILDEYGTVYNKGNHNQKINSWNSYTNYKIFDHINDAKIGDIITHNESGHTLKIIKLKQNGSVQVLDITWLYNFAEKDILLDERQHIVCKLDDCTLKIKSNIYDQTSYKVNGKNTSRS